MSGHGTEEHPDIQGPTLLERINLITFNTVVILMVSWGIIVAGRKTLSILADPIQRSSLIEHGTLPALGLLAWASLTFAFRNRIQTIVRKTTQFAAISSLLFVAFFSFTCLENALAVASRSLLTRSILERFLYSIFMSLLMGTFSLFGGSKSKTPGNPPESN